ATQVTVVGRCAAVVGMAFDRYFQELRVSLDQLGHGFQKALTFGTDRGLGRIELDAFHDHDLLFLDEHARAAVLLRHVIVRTGLVGAGVVGVDDAIAVAILRGRTAALGGVATRLSGFIRAGLVGVGYRVAVPISGGTAVLGRILGGDARLV